MDADCDILIVGGGPAGMMAGLLFARAGLQVTVLEKHGDFLRDFRGDTVHPSTLRIIADLGLTERFLARPHDKVPSIGALVGGRHYEVGDFSHFDRRWNFIAMMPQWEFLDFLADEARAYPGFRLRMNTEAIGLDVVGDRVSGIRYRDGDGMEHGLSARLVVACDGRRSILREAAGFQVRDLGAPMDVFWFRVPKEPTPENDTTGVFAPGRIIALIDRGQYWQCAFVFPKGEAERVRADGVEKFRDLVAEAAPMLAGRTEAIAGWDDVKLLTVALDRLERWQRPGLLVIGDAAHAMSPIGGVGINVAIQDAVAAANILAGPIAKGEDPDPLLAKVQRRRLPAVRLVQSAQAIVQRTIIAPLLQREAAAVTPPLPLRLLDRFPLLRRLPAAFIGFGYKAERVRSYKAGKDSSQSAGRS
jgi:2-polyprenyl-6-methoxyphenol hydroxylase-like FAD-dependent oxidoreductase